MTTTQTPETLEMIEIVKSEMRIARVDENWDQMDELDNMLFNLCKYGQVSDPKLVYDDNGYLTGVQLIDGTIIWNSGMTFENQD